MFETQMNEYKTIKFIICILSALLFCVWVSAAYGQSSSLNLSIPTAPGSYQSDRFKSGDLDCSNAIWSATNLEFGVTGIIGKGYTDPLQGFVDTNRVGDIGVFARIVIPLGKKPKSRVDCNRLYELELRKKQLEVMRLEQEIQQLRVLQFQGG